MNDLAAEVLRHAQRDAPEVSVRRGAIVEYFGEDASDDESVPYLTEDDCFEETRIFRVTFRRIFRGVAPVVYHVQTYSELVRASDASFVPQPPTRSEWKTLLTLSDARLALACLPTTNDADYKLYAGELRVAAFGVDDTVARILEAVV